MVQEAYRDRAKRFVLRALKKWISRQNSSFENKNIFFIIAVFIIRIKDFVGFESKYSILHSYYAIAMLVVPVTQDRDAKSDYKKIKIFNL